MQRRDFLHAAAAASSMATSAARTTRAGDSAAGRSRRTRRVALIGCGWYGKCDLLQLINIEPVEVVGLCDVDSAMLDQAAGLVATRQASKRRPPTFADYTDMLQQTRPEIVLIATPDHWHALPMIAAVESGADVYVQKPTGVDVSESKAMVDAARRTGRVVQVGTQRRSTPHLVQAKRKIVDAGLLGKVAFAEACCYYHMRTRKNPPVTPPPPNLDYDAWTGPAPMRPYTELVHPRSWRAFMEYGNGIVGDMCVHMLDMIRWQLDLGWPQRISSVGGIMMDTDSAANISDTQTATFDFPQTDVVWTHRSWGAAPDPEYPWAGILYGDKGTLKLSVQKYEFIPRGGGDPIRGQALIETERFPTDKSDQRDWRMELHVASAIRGHMRDFLDAIDHGRKPVADILQGHISSASCFMANVSADLGRTLVLDPATHQVVDDAEALDALKRPYRTPYRHPADA